MNLNDFNKGMDDAFEGNFRDQYKNNVDYIDGYDYGSTIMDDKEEEYYDQSEEY